VAMPSRLRLLNYPNPFNTHTSIYYSLSKRGYTEVEICDVLGRKARSLWQGVVGPGGHVVSWDGYDGSGAVVSSGVYICIVKSENGIRTRRMVLLK
jgi:hypothetical protein